MRPVVLVALASTILLAAPVRAQLTSKEAAAQLKAAIKTRTADAKAVYADEQAAMLALIAEYEGLVEANGWSADDAIGMFEGLNEHIGTISTTLFQACAGITSDAGDL